MGTHEFSDKYEGADLCTIDDVMDEIGPVLSKQSSTVFPDNRRDVIIGRWCEREQAKFFQFVGVRSSDLVGEFLNLSKDAVLFRVVIRVLKKIQANRTQRAGGVPSYQDLIEMYQKEQEMLELHIRSAFYPDGKKRDVSYPMSFIANVLVIDREDGSGIPGARIYVDNQWCSTTWKDGKVSFPLEDREVAYDVQARIYGYKDSKMYELDSENSSIVISLDKEE